MMYLRRILIGGSAAATAAAVFAAVAVGKNGEDSTLRVPAASTGRWDRNWDRREPMSLVNLSKINGDTGEEELNLHLNKHKAKATRHIFLIRHSQYKLEGKTDVDRVLTSLGREQAELTGQRLANLGFKYSQIVHSSMTRARETMEIISKYLPGVQKSSSDLLREGAPIRPDPPVCHWKPDVEYYEDGPRIEAAFRNYIHRAEPKQEEDTYEIIICHANVIRYIVCRALQLPPEAWLRMSLNNGSITYLVVRPSGNVSLRMLGDSGFMPPDKLSRT
ncbi:serine/threonine-protein phosphatase PGAM5, mitochondrial isoform 2-T2 [Anomaloglossus baeobatrachus]|uniref:serine/threonine-protein phosphatase PGAM5, mitochondrial isoform X2 n=1 Tax=Anomaloglossus baeobatrachus TaxID=238106 RepID=UPI003F4FC07E